MHYTLLLLVCKVASGKPLVPLRGKFDEQSSRTIFVPDQLTDNFVVFEPVYTNRNLRGLFPEEDERDSAIFRQGSGLDANLSMVGQGGQVAYVTEIVGLRVVHFEP